MAALRPKEASSSSISRFRYQVFLSFRGEDIRKTFIDHLYIALVNSGIRTFRDDDGIERGEDINLELQRAIKESKISLVVFSKNYASSKWCLNELVEILEHKDTGGHIILPIFYDVDPSDVRKQEGSFAKPFARHEEQLKTQMSENKKDAQIEKWKAALTEAANLAGMVLGDKLEAKFIQEIVAEVSHKLNRTTLSLPSYIVGIDSQVEEINLWLQDESVDSNILVICGMGGMGKTTIAKYVYNLHFERFEGSCFLADIRKVSAEPNGLVHLQKQLLSEILKNKVKIWNVDEGITKIKDNIGYKRVLIVLDDVDRIDQLNKILGARDWFYPGSKIIITTRQKQLLKAHDIYKVLEIGKLDSEKSFRLFNLHAFGQDEPVEGHVEQSRKVAHCCGGMPLALEVMGSFLSGKSVVEWESALKRIEEIPNDQILKVLRISYDSLPDIHYKNFFLDIVCFFVGKDKDYVITILDGCDYATAIGLRTLMDRFLLTVNENKKLEMHQLLQDMGREIICEESYDEPEKRSRLWRRKDVLRVLREKNEKRRRKRKTGPMGYLRFELNLQSASNLPNLRRLYGKKMKVYARVTVNDDIRTLAETPVDKKGGTNPVWNFPAKYIIDNSAIRPQDDTMLTIRLYYKRSLGGDGYIGEVRVPLKVLFQRSNQGREEVFESYAAADPMQQLNFSYKFTTMTNTETTGSDWMMKFIKLGWIIVQIVLATAI